MDYDSVIAHFGTQAAVARALGIAQPSVFGWRKGGIPPERQLQLQRLTKGELTADPDVLERFSLVGIQTSQSAA